MRLRMELLGAADLQRGIADWGKTLEQQHGDAIEAVGERVFALSQAEVPVVSGRLKASGRMVVSEQPAGRQVDIVYTAPYALKVHEADGGTPYLEGPLMAVDVEDRVPAEMKR